MCTMIMNPESEESEDSEQDMQVAEQNQDEEATLLMRPADREINFDRNLPGAHRCAESLVSVEWHQR